MIANNVTKVSELTVTDLMNYAHEYSDDPETIKLFTTLLITSKGFIRSYTGLSDEQMDLIPDLIIAVKIIANELYDNRAMTVQNEKVNPVVKTILDMHSINLL